MRRRPDGPDVPAWVFILGWIVCVVLTGLAGAVLGMRLDCFDCTEQRGRSEMEYREFPRTLHRSDGSTRRVVNEDEKTEALADGWALSPFVDLTGNRFDVNDAPGEVAADTADADGADVVDLAPRRKKGPRR